MSNKFDCKNAYYGPEHGTVKCKHGGNCKFQRWCEMEHEWQVTTNAVNCKKRGSDMFEEKDIIEMPIIEEEPKKEEIAEEKKMPKKAPKRTYTMKITSGSKYGGVYVVDENNKSYYLADREGKVGETIEVSAKEIGR